jgi:CDP-paratose 2-epimerase
MGVLEDVLVTGGAGFVGSHIAEHYAEQGASVTVLDNLNRVEGLPETAEARDSAAYNRRYLDTHHPEIEFVRGDVRDAELVGDLVADVDAVVHTAGQVAVTASLEDPRTDFEINAGGTFNVIDAAAEPEPSPAVAFASTNKVYGTNVNEIPVREEQTRYRFDDPEFEEGIPESLSIDDCEHTPYGVSKLAGDLYVQDYAARNEVPAAAFRMSCIYGPRQFGSEDQGWLAHFAISAARDEGLTIFGDGKQVRDVLYVKDLVRAYDAFLSDPEGKPSVFNIGGGPEHTTSLVELLDLMSAEFGWEPEVAYEEWREGDQKVYVSDISRAREALDWEPRVDLSEGLRRFVDWFEDVDY